MSILFICHETGRTNSILKIAETMREKTDEEFIFLLVGKAAINLFNVLPANHMLKTSCTITPLTNFFDQAAMDTIEKNPLTQEQRQTIQKYLADQSINKVLIGAPSWHNAMAPFQIAEDLIADDIYNTLDSKSAFILDGDYYIEDGCAFWSVLSRPDTKEHEWRKQFTWLASMENSKKEIARVNSQVKVAVIGDPAIDQAIAGNELSADQARDIRQQLVSDGQSLLLASGTKNIADDEELLTLLLDHLPEDTVQIRFVLHPGTLNSNDHITRLLTLTDAHKNGERVKFIVDNTITSPLSQEFAEHKNVCFSAHSRENIAEVADGIACAIPGTQLTRGGIAGQPVLHTRYTSYLPESRRHTSDQVDTFFAKVQAKQRLAGMTKQELELPEEKTASIVSRMILG